MAGTPLQTKFISWALLAGLGAALTAGGFQCRARHQAEELAAIHRDAAEANGAKLARAERDLVAAKLARGKLEEVAARLRALPRTVTTPREDDEVEVKAGATVTAKRSSLLLSKARVAEIVAIGEAGEKAIKDKESLASQLRVESNKLAAQQRKSRAWRNRSGIALIVGFGIGYAVAR